MWLMGMWIWVSPSFTPKPLNQQQVRGMANHRHKKIIKMAKGYRGRTNCFRIAIQRVERALRNAYKDRKVGSRHGLVNEQEMMAASQASQIPGEGMI